MAIDIDDPDGQPRPCGWHRGLRGPFVRRWIVGLDGREKISDAGRTVADDVVSPNRIKDAVQDPDTQSRSPRRHRSLRGPGAATAWAVLLSSPAQATGRKTGSEDYGQ